MHTINSLYTSAYDFDVYLDSPRTEVMVATVPRAGSTYFCIELWKTGILGSPLEYPNLGASRIFHERMNEGSDFERYWQAAKRRRTGPNGLFSYKMFEYNYHSLSRANPKTLGLFRPDYVIYLTRADKLAQAISYSKAIKSQAWFASIKLDAEPEYDHQHIKFCLALIKKQEFFWEKIFALTKTEIYRVTYEDYLERSADINSEICRFVGQSSISKIPLPVPNIEKQGIKNSLWRQKFLEMEGELFPACLSTID